jgi:beta-galactosidase
MEACRCLNDSPMQRRLREGREWFVGAVYWMPGDYDPGELRRELRRMHDLGFNAVRYHSADPTETRAGEFDFTRTDDWMNAAEEAGIRVILHANLTRPSDALLADCGLDRRSFLQGHLDAPKPREALERWLGPIVGRYRPHPALLAWGLLGEPEPGDEDIDNEYDRQRFGRWLRERYGTIDRLDEAWNLYPQKGRPIVPGFEEAWRALEGFGADRKISGAHRAKVNYGAARDMLRYLTEKLIARAARVIEVVRTYDPDHPVTTGSHQLFANQAALRWDIGRWARLGDLHFSSIHLSWHFEPVEGEVDRPVYMQARQTRDYFKGGWTSAFETTGGAVQYSGGYGNAMTAGLMRRLMLSYLAAGNVNIAFWTWNHRPGGWEAGEYGLTTLSGEVSPWAEEAGRVARAMAAHKDELWQAEQDVRVGVLEDWDTQAILALEPERHELKAATAGRFGRGTAMQASRARIGVSRALINAHVPFEYVTSAELLEGIALRYPVIYAPHLRALGREAADALGDYVRRGGRLIADVQFAFLDPWGKLHPTGLGGLREGLFGAWIDTIHDARTDPRSANGIAVEGFFGDLRTTSARVICRFDDGRPAVSEARVGKGTAVLVAFDAARMCHRPGNLAMEGLLADLVTAGWRRPWRCTAPMTFRLSAPKADHYFLINDSAARTAFLSVFDREYTSAREVIEEGDIDLSGTIAVELPAQSAKWLRFER